MENPNIKSPLRNDQTETLKIRINTLQQQIEKHQKTQNLNDKLLRFERLLSELSSRLINLAPGETKKQIEYSLGLLASFLDLDQIGIVEYLNESRVFKTIYSYTRGDIRAPIPELPSESYPWWAGQIQRGNIVVWQNLPEDAPTGAESERQYAIDEGIKAHLSIPLKVGNNVMGALACHSFTKPRQWSDDLTQRFRLFGEIMANTITRHRSEIKLEHAYEEIKTLKERLEAENLYLREEVNLKHRHEGFIGESRAVKSVLSQVEQVAVTSANVLITGETGTGKELIAKAIHKLSARKRRALVTLNCAALPPTLVESELFGHEKGAYTGALARRQGRFAAAHESTIFLDEINALSLEMQAKLLRVVQHGTFEMLGSTETKKVDVRIIAASNQNLKKEVAAGSFRQDLYYRLNVFPITVPPLRDRTEDIPLLVWAFVNDFSKQMGKQIDTIPAKSMATLERHFWPGNVRELKNLIERAMIITRGTTLTIPDIETPADFTAPTLSLDDVQRRHILDVLDKTGWRVSGKNGAAQMMNINPKTLESRMKKLGIHRKNDPDMSGFLAEISFLAAASISPKNILITMS